MALNTLQSSHLMPLRFKGLMQRYILATAILHSMTVNEVKCLFRVIQD